MFGFGFNPSCQCASVLEKLLKLYEILTFFHNRYFSKVMLHTCRLTSTLSLSFGIIQAFLRERHVINWIRFHNFINPHKYLTLHDVGQTSVRSACEDSFIYSHFDV